MDKYIDADKLIAEIEYRKNHAETMRERGVLIDLLSFIESLQQEQDMPDSAKLIELWHEDEEMLKEKDFRNDPWRLAYNAFMCGFGRGVAVKRQEQMEVDLEKEIDRIWDSFPPKFLDYTAFANLVTHFYELGLKARKGE